MSGLYIKLDVEYASDEEFIDAGPMAELLYLRALCFIKRKNLDGFLKTSQLLVVASGIPTPNRYAQKLVEVGLFTAVDGGYHIPAFLKRNMSRAEIEASKDLAREAGERGAHERWHVAEGKPNAKCRFCVADRVNGVAIGVPHGGANGVAYLEEEPEPEPEPKEEPEPEPESYSRLTTSSTGAVDKSLDEEVITRIIDHRMSTSSTPIGNPKAYRVKVDRDVRTDHAVRISELTRMFPTAPADTIAHGVITGDTRNLAHHVKQPEPEPDEPKLTPEQIKATLSAAKGES